MEHFIVNSSSHLLFASGIILILGAMAILLIFVGAYTAYDPSWGLYCEQQFREEYEKGHRNQGIIILFVGIILFLLCFEWFWWGQTLLV